MTTTDGTVDLDEHRSPTAQKMIEMRRQRLHEYQIEREPLRAHEEKLKQLLDAGPAETWFEGAAKAQFLLQLFAALPEAGNPKLKQLIVSTLGDFERLNNREKEPS